MFDTLFTSADFVEDSERAAVHGHIDSGRSDSVYSFAPAEVSVLLDTPSEELAFPNIHNDIFLSDCWYFSDYEHFTKLSN